ncbi:hypothetical protein M0R45_011841 [Rubus argutus]|uniref:Uncharacterized protein n=1 Tax=Rubus argutus TaxID=59490 RepID=A0AAW1YBF7_RUBAR
MRSSRVHNQNRFMRIITVAHQSVGQGQGLLCQKHDRRRRQKSYGTRIDVDKILQDQLKRSATTTTMGSRQVLPKCGSVAMGRIDEDDPCDFEEEGGDAKKDLYPRSRSYAVGKRSVAFV